MSLICLCNNSDMRLGKCVCVCVCLMITTSLAALKNTTQRKQQKTKHYWQSWRKREKRTYIIIVFLVLLWIQHQSFIHFFNSLLSSLHLPSPFSLSYSYEFTTNPLSTFSLISSSLYNLLLLPPALCRTPINYLLFLILITTSLAVLKNATRRKQQKKKTLLTIVKEERKKNVILERLSYSCELSPILPINYDQSYSAENTTQCKLQKTQYYW